MQTTRVLLCLVVLFASNALSPQSQTQVNAGTTFPKTLMPTPPTRKPVLNARAISQLKPADCPKKLWAECSDPVDRKTATTVTLETCKTSMRSSKGAWVGGLKWDGSAVPLPQHIQDWDPNHTVSGLLDNTHDKSFNAPAIIGISARIRKTCTEHKYGPNCVGADGKHAFNMLSLWEGKECQREGGTGPCKVLSMGDAKVTLTDDSTLTKYWDPCINMQWTLCAAAGLLPSQSKDPSLLHGQIVFAGPTPADLSDYLNVDEFGVTSTIQEFCTLSRVCENSPFTTTTYTPHAPNKYTCKFDKFKPGHLA